MRAVAAISCLLCICGSYTKATGGIQEDALLRGHWRGAIVRLNAIQSIEIDLMVTTREISGTYAIPDLALYDEPLRDVSLDDSTLTFRILYGSFALRRHHTHQEMTGGNDRWNPPLAMHLKHDATPRPAFWTSEDLTIPLGSIVLSATLFKPVGPGPFPAVVVVPGNGDQSRTDWHLRSHAYALAKSGVACLVYDKRGVGESTGNYKDKTFHELARDANAAIDVLRKRDDIRDDAIGLMGISQGGWISTIAAHNNPAPDFVVFMQGPARSLHDQDLDRVRYEMIAAEFARVTVDSAVAHTQLYFDVMDGKAAWSDLERSTAAARASAWAGYVSLPDSYDDEDMRWWRNAAYDPAEHLRTFPVPALVILGDLDPVVPWPTNMDLFGRYFREAGIPHSSHIISGLYHATATYHSLEGGVWNWPYGFWVWSKRPHKLDAILNSWITEITGTR